ncbi:uncharacterized protein BP01DRAFT_385313 [Aspergillus saccharolyticus JOP 1030-1]|uniref:Uncharacterized protein n=1 Tax=Aspergillus saccharolyticus JOP 1030-1 TaxID=1450539 RepID=A0A318Z5S6_9EURO|nr:hypothetical protein BP01DRAFT_385313 [Aspergillus saccharolyticus JOP 1030-1]PYH42655.1 hypothetical protein BP01DRAFT_385313 [Aspergillus saccharolyticus JOP 1030-1]
MLQCWEHVYPKSHFIRSAQPANLHIASFPIGNNIPEADGADTPYAYWHAAAIGYQGSPLNESLSNSKKSTNAMPYITAVYNTTTLWQDITYSIKN